MSITGLYMENIRCFHGKHYIPLKPLTILVGENSTGKTTILGTLSAFFQGAKTDWLTLNLNRPPFEFGRFEDIASFPNNQTERAIEFSIGLDIPGGEWYPFEDSATVVITFVNLDGEPVCRSIYVETQDIVYIIKRKSKNIWQYSLQDKNKLGGINTKSDQFYYKLVSSKLSRDLTDIETNDMSIEMGGLSGIIHQISEDATKAGLIDSPEQFQWPGMFLLGKLIKTFNPDIKNIAPIRIKPRRTYQSHEEIETAEGNHIPFVLERILRKKTNPKLISQIKEFGKASGLFSLVSIRRYSKPAGSRFGLKIKVKGPIRNIVDVGYGVSQVLPVLVDTILAPERSLITLQQPEVHLHPRAQAELGSLFVQLVKHDRKQIIVETHSDYIVDRIRQEIGNGVISNEDVQILFTELDGSKAIINEVELNERGDIIDPPNNYRKFFMEEELSLLRRGD